MKMHGINFIAKYPTFMMIKWILSVMSLVSISCSAAEKPQNPAEVGSVQWQRDYPAALEAAKTSSKPLLILFQEVPG